jgi:hypothetical protein
MKGKQFFAFLPMRKYLYWGRFWKLFYEINENPIINSLNVYKPIKSYFYLMGFWTANYMNRYLEIFYWEIASFYFKMTVRYWYSYYIVHNTLLGHSRLTHSYLLNNEERPECIPCISNYSLKHVLIDCVDVVDVRQTFYNVNCLSNRITNVAGDTIFQFLKEINVYSKI